MDFDFREQYKNWPTEDLLKITMHPDAYQPAAINAAVEILKNREITQIERVEAEKSFTTPENIAEDNKPLSMSIRDIFSRPDKWVIIILTTAILQYLPLLHNDINMFTKVINNPNLPFRSVFLGSFIDILFLPIVFFLFYKHNSWGWILLFVTKLFTIIPTLTFYYLEYRGNKSFPTFLYEVGINIAVAAILWKKDVRLIFNISNKMVWYTLLSIGLLSLFWVLRF